MGDLFFCFARSLFLPSLFPGRFLGCLLGFEFVSSKLLLVLLKHAIEVIFGFFLFGQAPSLVSLIRARFRVRVRVSVRVRITG